MGHVEYQRLHLRFVVLEALLSSWTERALTRQAARQRLALLKSDPEVRASALAWFDLRWPSEEIQ